MKKLLAMLLACAMIFTLIPMTVLSVSAAEIASGTSGEVTWTLSDDGTLTFSGEGAMADYSSTSATPWKTYASQIKKVVFASGVTHIGERAFHSSSPVLYSNLTEVAMTDVESIGTYAFRYDEALGSVNFGSKLSYIGPSAFSFCSVLDGIVFPESLKTIDHEAFNYCRALSAVVIPEGTETIEYSAFGNCTALTDATLPAGLTYIGTHIFNNCKAVTAHGYTNSYAYMYCLLGSINFDSLGSIEDAPLYATGTCGDTIWNFYSDGTLEFTGEGAMEDYTYDNANKVPWITYARQTTNVVIGENVTHVGAYAFYNSSNTYYPKLASVEVLGDASIGEAAFKYGKITEISFVGNVTELEKEAFAFCTELTEFTFADGLSHIGEAVFNGCKGLKSVTLPEGLTSIGISAFRSCSNLIEVYIPSSLTEIASNAFDYTNPAFYGYDDSWFDMYCLLNNMTLNFVDKLEDPAIYATGTTGDVTWTFYADGSLVLEGEGATADFSGTDAPWYPYRSQILSLEVCEGVTGIGTSAFAGCTNLAEITFDGDAPTIAANAFSKVTADAYYKASCEGWTENVLVNYGGKLTWIRIGCPHEYEAVVSEPTCTEHGYTTYTCSLCTDSYIDDYVDELGHDYVGVVTEPTCTEQGFTTYTCSRCEDSYIDDYTELAPHDYAAVVTEPTCTEGGYTTYTCKNCPDSFVGDETEALGHSYEEVAVAPTCTEVGYTDKVCTRCGDSERIGTVAPTGHQWDHKTVAPTCSAEGSDQWFCLKCGYTESTVIPALGSCPSSEYVDVPGTSNWAHAGIDFCIDRGIMGSTKTSRLVFEPGTSCTRAMIVSVLFRLSNEPDVDFKPVFPDVKKGTWYSDAVIWAYDNEVVKGYDTGYFGPDDVITREQLAVILKGYTENILGVYTGDSTSLDLFADCGKVKWSKDYVSWAVAVGMISGKTQKDGSVLLDPKGNASRAEVASILMRFIQNIVEA